MINKYTAGANKTPKEYKVKNCKTGTAKNGATYTMCNISDAKKKEGGGYEYDNYTVFTWQEDIKLEDNDKIVFEDIYALEVANNEYNGKTYLKKTIFADIKVTAQANPNKVEVVGDLPNFDAISEDTLPF
jgi:hypothetical protein